MSQDPTPPTPPRLPLSEHFPTSDSSCRGCCDFTHLLTGLFRIGLFDCMWCTGFGQELHRSCSGVVQELFRICSGFVQTFGLGVYGHGECLHSLHISLVMHIGSSGLKPECATARHAMSNQHSSSNNSSSSSSIAAAAEAAAEFELQRQRNLMWERLEADNVTRANAFHDAARRAVLDVQREWRALTAADRSRSHIPQPRPQPQPEPADNDPVREALLELLRK
jgi:hypothetical protein